ncbi:MAG: hypothetical protein ACYDHH_16790 [Solirubrobacteraceae bacterium]
MNRHIPLTIAAVATAMLILAAAALAVTQTTQSGNVTATLSYTVKTKNSFPSYSKEHLTITRGGQTAYDAAVKDADCGSQCWPGDPGAKGHAAQIVDINNSGEPNVVLTLYSGGAHCCLIAQVFTYAPAAQKYVMVRRNFEDPGFGLKKIGPSGTYLFVSADPRFGYEYTSFAQSGVPLQIFDFTGGAFNDVTKNYPSLIKKDAAEWLKIFKQHMKTGGTGVLAAWAADEELLGNDALVQSTLQKQLKAGHLTGGFVNGKKYVTLLNKDLVKWGYKK